MASFASWLEKKMNFLGSDEVVFAQYIESILNGEESEKQKADNVFEIISGITDSDVDGIVDEILQKWNQSLTAEKSATDTTPNELVDVESRLADLMRQQGEDVAVKREKIVRSTVDQSLKKAILQQYAEVSDVEIEDSDADHDPEPGLSSNREEVKRAELERREQMKQEAMAKREKDKQDREKQKQLQNERKEKEKKRTQKCEKKR